MNKNKVALMGQSRIMVERIESIKQHIIKKDQEHWDILLEHIELQKGVKDYLQHKENCQITCEESVCTCGLEEFIKEFKLGDYN